MTRQFTIALDAMGGDHAPDMVIAGADMALARCVNIQFLMFGNETRLKPLLAKASPALRAAVTLHHTPDVVSSDTKPSVAVRTGRNSSMRLAIDAVADGRAGCTVSAGNTGALMAMATLYLRTLPGIDRPAIASFFPNLRGETVMLDLGANVECTSENLVQFAIMGSVFAKTILGNLKPSVGLLNIGEEEMKGNETVKLAASLLRQTPLPGRFYGFVEGGDITAGTIDVVVTDGFTGNVVLKSIEGAANLYASFLRHTFESSLMAKLGYLFAYPAFRKLRARIDPRRYNGAMFLGLQGVCVKSHGGTDAVGFCNAIAVAVDMLKYGFNEKIKEEMAKITPPTSS